MWARDLDGHTDGLPAYTGNMRPRLAAGLLVVALLTAGYGPPPPTTEANSKVPSTRALAQSDDEAVVNAALLSFFKSGTTWNAYWQKGDYIVVRTKWLRSRGEARVPGFERILDGFIKASANDPTRTLDETLFRSLKQAKPGSKFKVEDLAPLESLILDKRILLDSVIKIPRLSRLQEGDTIETSSGAKGTSRLYVSLYPPVYSADGRFAIMSAGCGLGFHPVGFTFFLKRLGSTWSVVHVAVGYEL